MDSSTHSSVFKNLLIHYNFILSLKHFIHSTNVFTLTSSAEIKGNKQDKEKVQRLADLFSPPVNLLFTEGWDLAKLFALDSKKWLLVNIQETTEFASQMLNRDTWKNPKVQDLIRNAFVFWQVI
jgi:hypothetical protein